MDRYSGILDEFFAFIFFHNSTLSRGSKPAFAMYSIPMISASDSCKRLNGFNSPRTAPVESASLLRLESGFGSHLQE